MSIGQKQHSKIIVKADMSLQHILECYFYFPVYYCFASGYPIFYISTVYYFLFILPIIGLLSYRRNVIYQHLPYTKFDLVT